MLVKYFLSVSVLCLFFLLLVRAACAPRVIAISHPYFGLRFLSQQANQVFLLLLVYLLPASTSGGACLLRKTAWASWLVNCMVACVMVANLFLYLYTPPLAVADYLLTTS